MARTGRMRRRRGLTGWERLRLGLAAIAAASLTFVGPVAGLLALDCGGITLTDGCLFTNTGSDTSDPNWVGQEWGECGGRSDRQRRAGSRA